MRQTGITTKQIQEAPQKAVYIWVNSRLRYPKELAYFLGRTDIEFVAPHWIHSQSWRGRKLSGIVVDHAARLSGDQWIYLHEVRHRLRLLIL
jgi:hypothetical protein